MKIHILTTFVALFSFTLSIYAAEEKQDPIEGLKAQLKDPTQPFTTIVEMTIKEDKVEAFKKLAATAVTESRKEPGNLAYEVHQDVKTPTKFVFFEKWKSIDALKTHASMDYTKALLGALAELGSEPLNIRLLTPYLSAEAPASTKSN